MQALNISFSQSAIQPKIDIISELPKEVSFIIFSMLPVSSLGPLSLVSKQWKALSQDEQVWNPIFENIHLKIAPKYECIKTPSEVNSLEKLKEYNAASVKFIQSQIKMASKPTLANRFTYFLSRLISFLKDFDTVLPRKIKIQLVYLMLKYIKDELSGKLEGKNTPIDLNLFTQMIEILKLDGDKKDCDVLKENEKNDRKKNSLKEITWNRLFIQIKYLTVAVQYQEEFDKTTVKNLLKELFIHFINLGFDLKKNIFKEKTPMEYLEDPYENFNGQNGTLYQALDELQKGI